uniref:Uncharacterized protein n=1 Tax=Panagrolaimus davidi TaxID=227884 RepID=A0A914QR33_9BILA
MHAVSVYGVPLGFNPRLSSRAEILAIKPTKDKKSELTLKLKDIGPERDINTKSLGVRTCCDFKFIGQDPELIVIGQAWSEIIEKSKKNMPIGGVFKIKFFPNAPYKSGPFAEEVPFQFALNSMTDVLVPQEDEPRTIQKRKAKKTNDQAPKKKRAPYILDDEEEEES